MGVKAMRSWAVALSGALTLGLLATAAPAQAAQTYRFEHLRWGDTMGPTDLNDNGVTIWAGGCDGGCHSRIRSLGSTSYTLVQGFDGDYRNVSLSDINNNGDLLGTAPKNGVQVATLWLNGVAFDLTDPVNSALQFVPDLGPKYLRGFDLALFDVVNLPAAFLPDLNGERASVLTGSALTNARGDVVFGFIENYFRGPDTFGALIAIPTPSSLSLLFAGALAAVLTRRSGRRGRNAHLRQNALAAIQTQPADAKGALQRQDTDTPTKQRGNNDAKLDGKSDRGFCCSCFCVGNTRCRGAHLRLRAGFVRRHCICKRHQRFRRHSPFGSMR